jgi:superfamily I DNA/RNA helicase
MKLTDEQYNAVQAAKAMQSLKISALAGTGKTTTLKAIAQELGAVGKQGLYLAFNKAIASEAQKKFTGTGCEARTFHSLAYSKIGYKYKARLGMRLTESLVCSTFGVSQAVASGALQTVTKFLRSLESEPQF